MTYANDIIPKPFDVVMVEWEDATTQSGAVYDSPQAAVADYSPTIRKTVGLWCGGTKAVVVVADTDDRSVHNKSAVGGITYIPAAFVKTVTQITAAPQTKKSVRKR